MKILRVIANVTTFVSAAVAAFTAGVMFAVGNVSAGLAWCAALLWLGYATWLRWELTR